MANVVEDLQRGTAAINDIETALKAKGVIGESEEVPVEDFDDRIEEIGSEVGIGAITNNRKCKIAIQGNPETIKIEPNIIYFGDNPSPSVGSFKGLIDVGNSTVKIISIEDTPQDNDYGICNLSQLFNEASALHNIIFENEYYDDTQGTDGSAPLYLHCAFRNITNSPNMNIQINHINCSDLDEAFAYTNLTTIGDEQGTIDLSNITMVPRMKDDLSGKLVNLIKVSNLGGLLAGSRGATKLIMPKFTDLSDGIYIFSSLCVNSDILYIDDLDLSRVYMDFSWLDETCLIQASLKNNDTTGKITFKNGSGFGNEGFLASYTNNLIYSFMDVDPDVMVASLLDENYTPGTFTPTSTETRTIKLNQGFMESAYAESLTAIRTKFEAAGYTIEVAPPQ